MVTLPVETVTPRFGVGIDPGAKAGGLRVSQMPLVRFGNVPPEVTEAQYTGDTVSRLIDDDIYNLIRGLPKATLHEHLGGSTDMALYKMDFLAEGQRVGLDAEALRNRLRIARAHEYQKTIGTTDLHDDEERVEKPGLVRYVEKYAQNDSYLRTKQIENAYMASYLYTLKAARENVRYFELRTNPWPGNGKPSELVKFIQQGIEDAKAELAKGRQKIDYGVILLAYRHGDNSINEETGNKVKVDKAIEVAKVAINLRKRGYPVTAVDLAGDEQNHPVTDFQPFFDLIKRHNAQMVKRGTPHLRLGITVHAGETPTSGALSGSESVREAIRLAWDENTPVRIGHGIFAHTDPALVEEIKEKGIGIEMCPKSNVQTEAVDWYSDHPAPELSRQGVKVSISPDNQTVSKTDPTNEFVKLFKYRHVTHEDRKRMVLAALETAFIMDPEKKEALIQEVLGEFAYLESKPKMAVGIYKEQREIGNNPPLTFEVFDGLRQMAEKRRLCEGRPVNMRQEVSTLLGRPVNNLEYFSFQVRTWMQAATEWLAGLVQQFTAFLAKPPATESVQ